jgi:hypothetical protein
LLLGVGIVLSSRAAMQEALDPRIDRTLPVGFSLNPKKVAKK